MTSGATQDNTLFQSVDASFRGAARGQWAPVIETLQNPNETVFITDDAGAQKAKGSLVQAMRSRGKRLRSKRTSYNDQSGIVFWAEDKSGK